MQTLTQFIVSLLMPILLFSAPLTGQENLDHWQHQGSDKVYPTGIRSADWYKTATPAKSNKVIVAILDSGIDIYHPDLEYNIWVNPKEIPGNNLDDDHNGYVDDLHGWNFIGGPDGQSVVHESLEVTREYAKEKVIWENVNPEKLKGKRKANYEAYLEKKELVERKRKGATQQINEVNVTSEIVMTALYAAKEELDGDSIDLFRLEESGNENLEIAARIIQNIQEQGIPVESIDWLIDIASSEFESIREKSEIVLNYTYNPESGLPKNSRRRL